MDQATHNKIVSFIWGIADDVLRDLFKRGKYPDVILPMCVLRRMDAVLEPTKKAVVETKQMLDKAGITEQRAALAAAAGQSFYNTSRFTLRDLKSRASQQQLLADFEDYLNGFSQNVQDILENFKFRNQLSTLSKSDSLSTLIGKFLDPEINLSPDPVLNADRSVKHPGMDNHSMGTVFEELVRKFNEENNEEAGEHWTPRDAVRLMANLIFLPVADRIKSGAYLLYDGAAGTGGMLTVAEETLRQLATARGQQITTHLYAQEINPETYAICKADMLLKGEGENADHIVGGAEWSTLAHDAFPAATFDFMMSNPPYGKSWKKDLETMGGKDGLRDPRFRVMHNGDELRLVTRSSDGQMLFLANMVSKMNHDTPLGSRIAEVHNGSSLFTGDAGQGESNIRRWLIENDWLEAIVALPLNLFYNTGIATYIWLLTNRKPEHRRGKVQLIDATQWFKPLRKNLGKKNCELAPDDIQRICDTYLAFKEPPQSKTFPNAAFGYWKVTVERPLRLHSQLSVKAIESLRFASGDEDLRSLLYNEFGDKLVEDFATIAAPLEKHLAEWGIHHAVTRGLDSTVPLKPSGIPWLTKIPKPWEVRPLKQLLTRMDYGTSENARGEGKIRVLGMGHIQHGRIVIPEKGSLETMHPGLLLEKHDLLFNRTNSPELVGKVGLFEGEAADQITFASYLVRLRTRPEHNPFWLNYLLNSTRFWSFARSQALVSLHQANLNSSRYARMVLPVPITRDDQDAIVNSIFSQTSIIDRATASTAREIALLREHRTRLIADVVTGKLDVRPAVRQLPADPEQESFINGVVEDVTPEGEEVADAEP